MKLYNAGDIVYILENNMALRKCQVIEVRSGNFYTLRFGNGALVRLRGSRLYSTEAEAEKALQRYHPTAGKAGPQGYRSPYDYMR